MNGKEMKTMCHPRGFLSGISRLLPLSNQGFTLIELLVVVLIIGILAAIALPQYQKAVLKSRYTTLMPIAKGIAEGNEAYFMEHGTYAEDPTELPIKGQESYPDGTELRVVDDTDKDVSYVIATRPKLMPNNKYIVFQKHSGKFSDVTLCETTSDPLATWLCKDALKGQVVEGNSLSGTGWTGYILSGNVTNSDHFSQTYTNTPDTPLASGDVCNGTSNSSCKGVILNKGSSCYGEGFFSCTEVTADGGECYGKQGFSCGGTFTNGSTCHGEATGACGVSSFYNSTCEGSATGSCTGNGTIFVNSECYGDGQDTCGRLYVTFDHSTCYGNATGACSEVPFTNGSKCIKNHEEACQSNTYTGGSCCEAMEGFTCPSGTACNS